MNYEKLELSNEEESEIYQIIGKNVKKHRTDKGFTQLSLSLAMGHKAVGTVSMAELCINNKHFNIKHLVQISKILDIKLCELFDGIETTD